MEKESEQLIRRLKAGEVRFLDDIYLAHRDAFLNWITGRFNLGREESADLFQDTVIVFYENVTKGKLTGLTANLRTYLFSIGKNLALKRHRNKAMLRKHEEALKMEIAEAEDPFAENGDERSTAVKAALNKMEEPCLSILKRYYYFRQSMADIAEAMDYKNADTVKSQKSRCMKHLKSMVKNSLNG